MQKLYEKSPELAQEKATEIGKVIAQDAFNSAKSILTELKAFKESGSTEMFVPSVLTENIMPNYTVARVMDEVSTEALEALIAKAEAVQKDMYTEVHYKAWKKYRQRYHNQRKNRYRKRKRLQQVLHQKQEMLLH